MKKSVFISHAVKDRELAHEIVSLIEEGMGVPEGEIFCSSLDGYGIPSGENFVTYIRDQLLEPKVVVLLLTPAYFESKFCVSELGAAWIKSHNIFPILVPPLKYEDVKDVLLGVQVSKIDDDIKYNELLDTIKKTVTFEPKSQTKWDTKRRAFLKAIAPLLAKVSGPSMVPAAEVKLLAEKLDEAERELDSSEAEIRKLKQQLTDVGALKDKKELAAVQKKHGNSGTSEHFKGLADEIAKFRSVLRGREVFKFILSEHYDKPYTVNRFEDGNEFDVAERYGFVSFEDRPSVVWKQRQMKELAERLSELDNFVAENKRALEKSEDKEVPIDPANQDFWEHHYKI